MNDLLNALAETDKEVKVSAIIKEKFESGERLDDKQSDILFKLIPTLTQWQAQLNLLQSMAYLKIPQGQVTSFELFLRKALTNENKFIRAWAYNGFYVLACQYKQFQPEAREFMDMAMRDEPASVKARIRQIDKQNPLF